MKSQLFLIIIAVLAGAVLPIQAGLNVQMGKIMQQPVFAAFASFLIGTVAIFIYLLVINFDFSSVANAKSASPWVWSAGILGAFYVIAVIVLAPKLGTALMFGLIVAGQMIISLLLDHYGFLDLPVKTINWQRILGVVFLIIGVVFIRNY